MKYRKKPVVIDAMIWTGRNDDEVESFIGNAVPWQTTGEYDEHLAIKTLEGVMSANPGDWIIKGVKGEYYPCKPDIFAATYELAEDVEPPAPLESNAEVCDCD